MTSQSLDFLFRHVFLPPQLPDKSDTRNAYNTRALVDHLVETARLLRDQDEVSHYKEWATICRSLVDFGHLNIGESLPREALTGSLSEVRAGGFLLLHINLQNSGLLFRKSSKDEYIVETFEASPPAAEVLASEGALQWDFPSKAVAIPAAVFEDVFFEKSLIEFIEKASVENVKQFAASTRKAGSSAFESRDTATPAIIGQLLMAILEANGCSHHVLLTRKRIRDDVCWSDGAENPWRRCPTWLVLRVGIQRALCFLFGGTVGRFRYKMFMCYVLSGLVDEFSSQHSFPADRLAFARTKLARRVAKLEHQNDLVKFSEDLLEAFTVCEGRCRNSIRLANEKLNTEWFRIRARSTKQIRALPKRAPRESTVLSLTYSRRFLYTILDEELYGIPRPRLTLALGAGHNRRRGLLAWADPDGAGGGHSTIYDYLALAACEAAYSTEARSFPKVRSREGSEHHCKALMERIRQYQTSAFLAYRADPLQLSSMILVLMELWKALDMEALKLYPLLGEYRPGFPEDLMHVLHAPTNEEMRRLYDIEQYLEARCAAAETSMPSIFSDPYQNTFAVRYYDQCVEMKALMAEIRSRDDEERDKKEIEWKNMSEQYDSTMRAFTQATCLFFEDEKNRYQRYHDKRGCQKCRLERLHRNMKIEIHESLLPQDESQAKAVVFELMVPPGFAAWRDSTCQLIQLARRTPIPDQPPRRMLHNYTRLSAYMESTEGSIVLASSTKSFYDTHYSRVSFPVSLDQVFHPHGLKYGYFDRQLCIWISRQSERPSFAQLSTPCLPRNSNFRSIERSLQSNLQRLTSNEIAASQTYCPKNLTVSEFISFQDLRLGRRTQWIKLLRELAASNLNFGASEVGILISQLALIAGPPEEDSRLRTAHWILQDDTFCHELCTQIRRRLEAIEVNWREGQTVQTLLVLLLRMRSLSCSSKSQEEATELLLFVRRITHEWTRLLRHEIRIANNVERVQRRSQDALLAALLCRKTFALEADNQFNSMPADPMSCYLECAICVNQNLPSNKPGYIEKLPLPLRQLFISDLKLLNTLENRLQVAAKSTPDAISKAVNTVWTGADGALLRKFGPWKVADGPSGWIKAQSLGTDGMLDQDVHLNLFDGSLFIAGQPLGRLPDEYSQQSVYQQLFGDRAFMTCPSCMPGMAYMLTDRIEGHEIHFGLREDTKIMRARDSIGAVLEFVPSGIFLPRDPHYPPDLPLPLIQEHVHWLNLQTRMVEIRPIKFKWHSKPSNWNIDLSTNQAHKRNSLLVDPNSTAFNSVASIIEPFENRNRIIVYQPGQNNLSVQLPALELRFEVDYDGNLFSSQLQAVVDENQDAGTLYGLESKLVLRDNKIPEDRSIIATMGFARVESYGGHVRVLVDHNQKGGYYARFHINKILRRLECAVEPRLVYFKAYCHAATSFVQPDPLTGRTGTVEALECLSAGNAQPYCPLDAEACRILATIADLTPKRVYYPEKLKCLQKPTWSGALLSSAQHDDFRHLIDNIIHQSEHLASFNIKTEIIVPAKRRESDYHLLARARFRNRNFLQQSTTVLVQAPDTPYYGRDCKLSVGASNALEAAILVSKGSHEIDVAPDLAGIFEKWPFIQGYIRKFELHLFTELIDIDFPSQWGSMYLRCRDSSPATDKFELMFFFATLSFNWQIDMSIIRTLIAISIIEDFKSLPVPRWPSFSTFSNQQIPSVDYIVQFIAPHRVQYAEDSRFLFPVAMAPKQRRQLEQVQYRHEQRSEKSCKELATYLIDKWPHRDISLDHFPDLPLLDLESALVSVLTEWHRLAENYELSEHLAKCQKLLSRCKASEATPRSEKLCVQEYFPTPLDSLVNVTLVQMLTKLSTTIKSILPLTYPCQESSDLVMENVGRILTTLPKGVKVPKTGNLIPSESNTHVVWGSLRGIIGSFVDSKDAVRREYGQDLQRSMHSLQSARSSSPQAAPDNSTLVDMISEARKTLQIQLDQFRSIMTADFCWLQAGALLPDITPVTLLESLGISPKQDKSRATFNAITAYGLSIARLQLLLRIQAAMKRGDDNQLIAEIEHIGRAEIKASDDINWLLLQIDFNFLIRPDQRIVAEAMISPQSGSNSVLQLNCGQGKSSVIIPMIVTKLANSKNLVRAVVPRALLQQTAQLLQARLGGLVGRKVKHIPFSRKSSTEVENIKAYRKLHLDVRNSRGVILTLPEHLLSFQLSGLQQLVNGHIHQADYMMKVQSWFSRQCRDILDECDHMLAVKTQLIYPSGSQRVVDGHPMRWKVVQSTLKLTKIHAAQMQQEKEFSRGIEIIARCQGAFPTIYLLNEEVKNELIQRLIESILQGEGAILPIGSCTLAELNYARLVLQNPRFARDTALNNSGIFDDDSDARRHLILLRGLLVHRILLSGLGKRWNVQYGVHPGRDPIAVPFRSKGIPSEQAEFGHPDVAIILTCLSFYFSGLTLAQFQESLSQLLTSDEPAREFESWVETVHTLPISLRDWNSINVDDEMQCKQLWAPLRQQMNVVNYFLNTFVFPRHAKTFDRKIVSSGWDISLARPPKDGPPIFGTQKSKLLTNGSPLQEGKSTSLTVGFSGTNDNKTLLPLNIRQNDLSGLTHTNAEVLTYLLQERNRNYYPAVDSKGKRLTERSFLHTLKDKGIRMLLDAGAQILELDNLGLAKAWLEVDPHPEAAVYFGEDERARVVYRDGKSQPLSASPFLNNLGVCLVYLDEAHTRGIDLKMPAGAIAALTLGMMQTKDHTVQAAMRLRQLATSQAVVWFAPPEVHQSILNFQGKTDRDTIDSRDVVAWLLEQTCASIEQLQPLYIAQGLDHCRRLLSARKNPEAAMDPKQRAEYLKVLEQPEQYSLEQLYGPSKKNKRRILAADSHPEIAAYVDRLNDMKKGLQDTVDTVQASAHAEVEQEREVAIEVETIREVQKPPHATPLQQPQLHKDVKAFAETGRLGISSRYCQQAFVSLRFTALGQRLGINGSATSSNLYVTDDFSNTIRVNHKPRDEYSRPVHWILWSPISEHALIVSDYEADAVLPLIRDRTTPTTHLLTYSTPVSKAMLIFDTLNVYSVPQLPVAWRAPPWLVRDLGLFAGRLYFDYDEQYPLICESLGLPPPPDIVVAQPKHMTEEQLWRELPFGDEAVELEKERAPFSKSPLLFMQEWLSIRRKGQDFSQTMMGEVCRGRSLAKDSARDGGSTSEGE